MSHVLLRSSSFIKAAKRHVKKDPTVPADIQDALWRLSQNAFDPALKSHRLKGILKGSWACSAGYDLRIVFSFVDYQGKEAILLQTLGTHDEVY